MRRAIGLGVLVFALCAAQAAAAPTPPLSHEGFWITDAKGRAVILHGVNMVYKRPPYHPRAIGFNRPDARFLRRHGFNNVRLGTIYGAVEPQPGQYDAAYLRRIKRTQQMLARQRIFSMIDFHQDLYNERFSGEGFPAWATIDDGLPAEPLVGFPGTYLSSPGMNQAFNNFWLNRAGPGGVGLQDRYAAAWLRVAKSFKRRPWVMGYDLINEPWPGSQWPTCANTQGCPAFESQFLAVAQGKAIERIRQVDRRHLIWYEPVITSQFGTEYHHPDTGDPRAGMSFHIYCLIGGPFSIPGLNGLSCPELEELSMQNANERAAANGDTLLMSEFGATDDAAIIGRMTDLADEYMTSWQWWHYCNCNDPTTSGVGDVQAIVSDPKRPPRGENLFRDKLALIERPYPQAVNGTPTSFSFDRETLTFKLEFERKSPAGKRIPRRVRTHVFVPRIHYHAAYEVEARGVRQVSKPGKRILRLRWRQRAREASVTVTPAGKG